MCLLPGINSSGESSTIYEYTHGGTSPVETLADPGIAFGCAFDPTTGNLAVANFKDYNNPDDEGDVAVYTSEAGTPTIYNNQGFFGYYFCGYDGAGDLFITAVIPSEEGPKAVLVDLAKGSDTITQVNLTTKLFWGSGVFYPSVQWDGQYMTVSSIPKSQAQHTNDFEFVLYRLSIEGSNATIVGTTTLKTEGRSYHVGQVAIQSNTLLAPFIRKGEKVGLWPYPGGGSPATVIATPKSFWPAVGFDHFGPSVRPSRLTITITRATTLNIRLAQVRDST